MSDLDEIKQNTEQDSPNASRSDLEKGGNVGEVAPAALTWDSPTDPDNPRNWPFKKRAFHTAVPALFGFVM